jgi:L-alanine-DL-glutamate epimerase-like enolase superfamily enzyme
MSGTTIASVELWHFSAPLPATFRPSWIPGFPQNENRCTLIRITTEDGVEGWSAGPAIARERAGLGQLIGPYLIGEDGTDIAVAQQRLREIGYLGWRNWWIEPAFWDVRGKVEGKPVCSLLGGSPRRVNLYASTGEVRSPERRVEDAESRLAEGFRSIKLRVHGTEEEDEAVVRAVGDAMRGRMKVGVDANQAWRVAAVADAPLWDLERAKRFSDVCADVGIAWLEEPLPMDAYDDLAALTEYSRVPIAGGELHTAGYPELAMMVERRCYSIFQPDALFTGGIEQTFRLIQLVKRAGLTYTPHTWTNGVGLAVNLHLMAASGFADDKELEFPYDPPGWTPAGRDAMLAEWFAPKDGTLEVPSKPGLGIEIDRVALRKHGKRFFKMNRRRLVFFALKDRGLRAAREMDEAKRTRLEKK